MRPPIWLVLPLTTACSEMAFDASSDENDAWYDTGYSSAAPEDGGGSDGAGDADDGYEPETEDDFGGLAPAPTDAFVFIANTDRNTVTRVHVDTLSVITTEVGTGPVAVETTADYRRAVTFNAASDDVSIIDTESLEVRTVDVRANLNALQLSPDGTWAIVYNDPDEEDVDDSGGGAQSFNEVSLVDLEAGVHYPRVTGFHTRDVQFTADGSTAVVVSDTYLAIVDLSGDEPEVERIQIAEDLLDPPMAEEVLLVPDGSYAFVRQFAATRLVLVDLVATTVEDLPVGANPTDLDVTPDGSQAVAVARTDGELWIYDLADPLAEPEVVPLPEDYTFGSVLMSPDDSQGLLYSTASGQSVYAAWDRTDNSVELYGLVKPVQAVSVSPDGAVGLVFHDAADGDDTDPDSAFSGRYALTLVDLSTFFANPLLLAGEPTHFTNSDDGAWGAFVMEGQTQLVALDYGELIDHEVALKSQPEHVGMLPGSHTIFASQEHELGRVSFYDPDADVIETITGFELNSGIEY